MTKTIEGAASNAAARIPEKRFFGYNILNILRPQPSGHSPRSSEVFDGMSLAASGKKGQVGFCTRQSRFKAIPRYQVLKLAIDEIYLLSVLLLSTRQACFARAQKDSQNAKLSMGEQERRAKKVGKGERRSP